eukprot:13960205-Alexandrium_andersonii.AAC.1
MCIRDRLCSSAARHRMHPSGVSGTDFVADPGAAQFQVRTPERCSQFPLGGLRIAIGLQY